jgi:hypothetical protein
MTVNHASMHEERRVQLVTALPPDLLVGHDAAILSTCLLLCKVPLLRKRTQEA